VTWVVSLESEWLSSLVSQPAVADDRRAVGGSILCSHSMQAYWTLLITMAELLQIRKAHMPFC
jgi:hypothetical protein